jgi:tetratricopeptide (TPR) repeat protein
VSWALAHQGVVAYDLGEYDRAQVLQEESLALAREVGNKVIIAFALSNLAEVLRSQRKVALALPLLDEGIALFREIGSGYNLPPALRSRGDTALSQREFDRASAFYRESLRMWANMGGRRGIAECLEAMASLAVTQGDLTRAARLYAVADAVRETIGAPRPPRSREACERDLAAIRAGLGDDAFGMGWKAGQGLTLDQAIDLAQRG